MAATESARLPEWVQRERSSDLAWIQENLHVFWPLAQRAFQDFGRGALVIDTTTVVRREQGQGNPIAYLRSAEVEAHNWQDVMRMVTVYDPTFELVAILLKDKRESVYRIQIPEAKR